MKDWLKANKWFIVAYVVFVVLFWFLGMPHLMSPFTAYVGVILLHLVFAFLVWVVKHILER